MNKISVGVWTYGACSDRYVSDGYKDRPALSERIRRLGAIEGVDGIEITYPSDMNENDYAEYEPLLKEQNLSIAGMGVEIVCHRDWKTGSFTSPDASVRKRSVELVKRAMDFAASIGVKTVSLWMGQDGFDYMMQADYVSAWKWLIEGLKECAAHNPSINLGLEYKASEPRLACFVNSGGKALALAQAANAANVGVTMDVGHAFNAKENAAEIASVLMTEKRLFHMHFNDNYLIADDDMPVGSVHFLHFAELIYWLKKTGYSGWYSLDMYPYRDDPDEAVRASVAFLKGMDAFAEKKLAGYDFNKAAAEAPSKILTGLFGKIFEAVNE